MLKVMSLFPFVTCNEIITPKHIQDPNKFQFLNISKPSPLTDRGFPRGERQPHKEFAYILPKIAGNWKKMDWEEGARFPRTP